MKPFTVLGFVIFLADLLSCKGQKMGFLDAESRPMFAL